MKEAIARYLRGPGGARILNAFGIDPRRYWLLMDLFEQLTDRREMFGQLGREAISLQTIALLYSVMTGIFSLAIVWTQPSLVVYFWAFQGLGGFFLLSVLLPETGNSLVNPVEALVLAHQPIDGSTYIAAKLTHLLRILIYLVPGLNAIPAMAGLLLKHCPWFYPFLHMAGAFAVGLSLALICCAIFGWLIRFVPAPRLKAAGEIAAMLPFLAALCFQFLQNRLRRIHIPDVLPVQAVPRRILVVAIVLAAVVGIVLGIRALSVDYLVRVSSIVSGTSSRKSRARRSRLADAVAWLFGGPASRAGFEYMARMIVRDYQFRRQALPMIALVVMPLLLLIEGWRTTPFASQFTTIHILPHALGMLLFMLCSLLVYGNDYKAVWIFLLAPAGAFGPFARGIYAWTWLKIVVIPHILLLFLLSWSWGFRDAALFLAYSLAMSSVYLGLELRLVDGLPFGKQPETRSPVFIGLLFLGGIGMAIVVGVQYFLVFRSRAVVLGTALGLGAAAYFVTRASLHAFEVSIRFHLGLLSTEAKGIYREVDA